ncbi:putative retrotransposon gag domain, aspartic peptidase domain superfamily [Helianthus debilis subsp. tardiflorus]
MEGEVVTWVELVEALKIRFGKLFDDPMTDLKNLKQISYVQEYHDKFDAIISRLQLPMEYALSCFMAGLEEEIQLQVRMFNPKNIQEAFCLAKLQEATNKAKRGRVGFKPPILPNPSNNKQPVSFSKTVGLDSKRNVIRKTLTKSEMDERRSKGLCFNCDEKYSQEHICKGNRKPQLYHIEVEWLEEEVEGEEEEVVMECAQILVNAVEGNDRYKSIRITGHYGKYELQLLMDTGRAHNFLDTALAKLLGCKMVKGPAMLVKVANGHEEVCDQMVKGFCWIMHGIQFTADVYVIPLGGCDMVLGVQWFTTLGSIKMNYNDRTIAFKFNGQKVVLRGQCGKKFSQLNKGNLKKIELQRAELSMVQVYTIEGYSTNTSMVLQKTQQSNEQQQ